MEGGDGYKKMSLGELLKNADSSISEGDIPEAKRIRDYLLTTDYFMSAGPIDRKIRDWQKSNSH